MNSSEVFVIDRLRAKGYKLTKARRAVIQALADADTPLDINDLYKRAQAVAADLGLVTVYRTLEVLDRLDLVRRVHMMNDYHGYAIATPGHTHHVVCQNCHTVVEIEGCDISPFTNRVREETGFTITGHWLELEGLCPDCQRKLAESK
jgi:Fur family ferric uptake transcriptional regulator